MTFVNQSMLYSWRHSQQKWQLSKDIQVSFTFLEAFQVATSWPGGHFLIAVSEKIIQVTIS